MAPLASAMALKSIQRQRDDMVNTEQTLPYAQGNKYFKIDAKPLPMSPVLESIHKYNGKLMNSIWGLYNRNAPDAFQKNTETDLSGPRILTQNHSTSLGFLGHH